MEKIVVDYDLARTYWPRGRYCSIDDRAKLFRPAYLATTEKLHQSLDTFGWRFDDVLTVAASGDQAMRYAMHGAKRIETFDMTFCAKVIQDLKTSALRRLGRVPYVRMLDNLRLAQNILSIENLMDVDFVRKVVPAMPKDSAEFMRRMSDCNLFCAGISHITYALVRNLPTPHEYEQMQRVIKTSFNFIWTDIADLHTHLNRQYDVINISNIFDWLPDDAAAPILKSLFPYLKSNGYILASMFGETDNIYDNFKLVRNKIGGAAQVQTAMTTREELICLQRVR